MTAAERWRPIVGFEGRYEVSDLGRVRSVERTFVRYSRGVRQVVTWKERIRKQFPHPRRRYMLVNLKHPDHPKGYAKVHRLVLEAFVGPCPEGMEVCHSNDISDDNRLENLRWDTKAANGRDRVRNGAHRYSKRSSCPHGHAYTPENTAVTTTGARRCRTCTRAHNSDYQKRNRAKARAKGRRSYAKLHARPREITCRGCGEPFTRTARGRQIYCSVPCRRRDYKQIIYP